MNAQGETWTAEEVIALLQQPAAVRRFDNGAIDVYWDSGIGKALLAIDADGSVHFSARAHALGSCEKREQPTTD